MIESHLYGMVPITPITTIFELDLIFIPFIGNIFPRCSCFWRQWKNIPLLRNAYDDFQISFSSQPPNTWTLKAGSIRHYLNRSRTNGLRRNLDFIAITPHYPAVSSVERYRKFSITFQILDGPAVICSAGSLDDQFFKFIALGLIAFQSDKLCQWSKGFPALWTTNTPENHFELSLTGSDAAFKTAIQR